MKDYRNALAKARDKFLEGEGAMLCQPNILKDSNHKFYLENRLVAAFCAGWKAKELDASHLSKSASNVAPR